MEIGEGGEHLNKMKKEILNKRYCVKIVGVDMEGKRHFCDIPFDCKPIPKVMGGLLINMATEMKCPAHRNK